MKNRTVIVGASVAGVGTARALRNEGYDGDVVLVEAEAELPYDKPPLSKGLLDGSLSIDDVRLLTEQEADELAIELVRGRHATGLGADAAGRPVVSLDDGTELAATDLVIATGARARRPDWADRPGVHILRTAADGIGLAAGLRDAEHVAIVGAGFIGCEVASAAVSAGLRVTVVDPLPVPMMRVLGEHVGKAVAERIRQSGVDLRLRVGVTEVVPLDRRGSALTLTDGSTVEADIVVLGIGAQPNDEWLAGSDVHVADGVLCDEYGRAEGMPRVYAVGDVARWHDPRTGTRERAEHWTGAAERAQVVARNIARSESRIAYRRVEYVWSDQFGVKIQVVGRPTAGAFTDEVAQEPGGHAYLFGDAEGTLIGAVAVGWPKATMLCRKALSGGASHVQDVRSRLHSLGSKRAIGAGVR